MGQSRQLAAIMFTDIVGYTALMGDNEEKAFQILRKNRLIQKPCIEKYSGKCIKEIGDGVLASFSSVSEAVLCAREIQNTCNRENEFHLRIGIHLGEVMFEENDIFGDGVNIASRLQAMAPIGGIWISESVYANVTNKKDISTRFIREINFKNVKDAVKVYEIITDYPSEAIIEGINQINKYPGKSIAVLPFLNMSNDPEQEYFSDGTYLRRLLIHFLRFPILKYPEELLPSLSKAQK